MKNIHFYIAGVEVGVGGGGGFHHIIDVHVMNYQQEMATNASLKWKEAVIDEINSF